jgi:hypothetical protein
VEALNGLAGARIIWDDTQRISEHETSAAAAPDRAPEH